MYWDLMQLGRCVRSGLIHTEERCVPFHPSLLPTLTSKSSRLLARSVLQGVMEQWSSLDCRLSSCPCEELEREAEGKTGA